MGFKIGIMADSLRLDIKSGIKKAARLGAAGVQIYAVGGAFCPDVLTPSDRQEYRKLLADNNLEISALCGDLGGHGFAIAKDNPDKIAKSEAIMALANELGASVVTTHIGVVPDDPNAERYKIMQDACAKLAAIGSRFGGSFAIETGPESPEVLRGFLDGIGAPGIGVNYDPANLVMVTGCDPIKGVYTLDKYICHTHAKDGICLQKSDPERVYNFFAEGGIEDLRLEEYFREVPLGQGQVDMKGWLAALRDVGYDGFLTIEREVGQDPAGDIAMAVRYLQSIL